MITNRGTLKREQDAIYTALTDHAKLATVAIVNCDDGDLQSLMDQAIGKIMETTGKTGAYIYIHQPTGSVEMREVQRPNTVTAGEPPVTTTKVYKPYIKITIWIACCEVFPNNRDPNVGTGIPALTLAEMVMAILHRPVSAANPIPRYTDGPLPMGTETRADEMPDTSKLGYLVKVETEGWATALDDEPITLEP